MASVLLTSLPVQGHLGPVVAVAADLVRRGHRVRVLTGAAYRDRVERAGADFLELPAHAYAGDLDHPERRPGSSGPQALGHDLETRFVRYIGPQFAAVEAALADEPADVLITELLFMGAYPLIVREDRPRVLLLGISPLPVEGGGTAPYGLGLAPGRGPLVRMRNAALKQLIDRWVFASPQRLLVEEFRRLTGRVPATSMFDAPLTMDAVLQLGPPGLEYPRPGLPLTVRFVGPLPTPAAHLPLPEWWDDLDDGRPVVHVTQGTVANGDFARLLVPAVRALAERPVLVVLTAGGRPEAELREALGEVPDNVRTASFLDYSTFLPKVSALVTNGGYGTVTQALAHGVPLVVAGRTEDKAEVAARVAWSGAGIDLRTDHPSPRRIDDAVGRVLGEPRFRRAAARLRDEIAVAGGLDAVDELVRSSSARSPDTATTEF
ncbi:glycosyltransferase [Kineococcus sp. NBC_00420]|uniref:glycosyltransferase n=1 Tax=Kineococcus sp. NBC_00420 TaxID=2903564 RepID=UPI002E24015D